MPIAEADLGEMLSQTEDVFSALGGARIFLTGGTGFFGVWLLSAFAAARRRGKADVALTVLSRDPDAARARLGSLLDDVDVVAGDARSFAFPDGSFSHVIHGATASSEALTPRETFDVILDGTRRALELAETHGASRFLYVSSGAVYGPQPSTIANVPETYAGGPPILSVASSYGEGKRAAEHLAAITSRGKFEVAIARGFAFVGPHLPLDVHFAIGNFLRDGMAGGPIRILGDGTPYRSYMYGTDLAVWLWTMLVRGRDLTAYNVGSGDGRPLRDIAERVAAATSVTVNVAKEPPPGHAPTRYVPDVSRAERDLGLSCRVSLDEGIARTIAFHQTAR